MSKHLDYTATAQRFAARFPRFTYVSIQMNFWVVANILLAIIMHLHALALRQMFGVSLVVRLAPDIVVAIILGMLYGICLGMTDYYLDKRLYRKKSLGKIILLKTIISFAGLILLLLFVQVVLLDIFPEDLLYRENFILNAGPSKYLFYLLVIYYLSMTLVINFINQVNRKYGPGVLVPLLLGKYRNPREEERIFMFMDLKSSTSLAEKLGHIKYSSFIRDTFMDINHVLFAFQAEVYQYVGDEIVVTWRVKDGLRNFACIGFFFACESEFVARADYYSKEYGSLPHFKAGLHMGKVTAVEIGEIKRDIAYHGDTLNTAARIQSACNEFNKKILISEYLLNLIDINHSLRTESLGMIQLRGKQQKVAISSIEDQPGNIRG